VKAFTRSTTTSAGRRPKPIRPPNPRAAKKATSSTKPVPAFMYVS